MLHILGWAVLGLIFGALGWLLRPRPRPLGLPAALLLSGTGAVFGGFVAWIFWDFPGNLFGVDEFITVPALVGDCLAAVGALVALMVATAVAMHEARR